MKVMFSVVSVRDLFCPQGGGGSHVTITHDALDLTVQPQTQHMRHGTPCDNSGQLIIITGLFTGPHCTASLPEWHVVVISEARTMQAGGMRPVAMLRYHYKQPCVFHIQKFI